MSLRFTSVIVFAALLLAALPGAAEAQSAQRCFPETGYCISGRMRSYWEQNGGLTVFGLPITPQQSEQVEGRATQVQWFVRNRLELHPKNSRPYDVLLGRLGATLRQAILSKSDTATLEAAAGGPGRRTIRDAAEQAVAAGLTTPDEIERVLGPAEK